jgi:hypothetical protein
MSQPSAQESSPQLPPKGYPGHTARRQASEPGFWGAGHREVVTSAAVLILSAVDASARRSGRPLSRGGSLRGPGHRTSSTRAETAPGSQSPPATTRPGKPQSGPPDAGSPVPEVMRRPIQPRCTFAENSISTTSSRSALATIDDLRNSDETIAPGAEILDDPW